MSFADGDGPSAAEIRAARARLGSRIATTPCWTWPSESLRAALGDGARVSAKLELWQRTGSFKARAALLSALDLDDAARARGVTAVSAGNHALAVAFAARTAGTDAKVVMPKTADPRRIAACKEAGATVVLCDDVHAAFAEALRLARDEGRRFIHPFESEQVVLGTATIGLEIATHVPDVEAVVVPIGGGGLCAGIACALGRLLPACKVYGVEPTGADSMNRSFEAGRPMAIDAVRTIADSLGAPRAEPMTFGLCKRWVAGLVRVTDDELRAAMRVLHRELAIAVEPACAASTAAALGPLAQELTGRRVVLVLCGSNIDLASVARHAGA